MAVVGHERTGADGRSSPCGTFLTMSGSEAFCAATLDEAQELVRSACSPWCSSLPPLLRCLGN